MIDITRIHKDFRKTPFWLNTNYKSLNSFEENEKRPDSCVNLDGDYDYEIFKELEQEFEWLYNQYCPCCATHHDMVKVNSKAIARNIIKKNEIEISELMKPIDDFFEISPEDEQERSENIKRDIESRKAIIEKYKNITEKCNYPAQDYKIYCPYYSKTHTGWNFELYSILCKDYEEVYKFGRKEYIAQIDIIKPILEKNKAIVSHRDICTNKVVELIKAAAILEKQIEDLSNRIPELERYADFLKENKEKTSKIIKSARKLENGSSSNAPVFDGNHQEYWRRVFDEFPGSIFRD